MDEQVFIVLHISTSWLVSSGFWIWQENPEFSFEKVERVLSSGRLAVDAHGSVLC